MKVLVACPYALHPLEHAGRARSALLISALSQEAEVHVLAPEGEDPEGNARSIEAAGAHLQPHQRADDARPKALTKLVTWASGKSELLRRRWPAAEVSAASRLAREGAFGCVVADSTFALPLLPEKPPLLLHLHNVESDVLGRKDTIRRPVGERITRSVEARLIAREEGGAARRARLTIVISDLDRERIRRLAPGARVEVVENFVDLSRLPWLGDVPPRDQQRTVRESGGFCRSVPESVPLILYVGSFDYPPNREAAEALLRVHLPALRSSFPGVRVRLVGKDSEGHVARLAREVGAEATGFVEDLVPHYREACAVYLPIASGGGTRTKVIEAFAVGRPVLSSALGVEGLPVSPGEHYLPADRPEEGTESLARVLRGETAQVTRRARRLVEERFTREAAARRFRELFRQRFRRDGGASARTPL